MTSDLTTEIFYTIKLMGYGEVITNTMTVVCIILLSPIFPPQLTL